MKLIQEHIVQASVLEFSLKGYKSHAKICKGRKVDKPGTILPRWEGLFRFFDMPKNVFLVVLTVLCRTHQFMQCISALIVGTCFLFLIVLALIQWRDRCAWWEIWPSCYTTMNWHTQCITPSRRNFKERNCHCCMHRRWWEEREASNRQNGEEECMSHFSRKWHLFLVRWWTCLEGSYKAIFMRLFLCITHHSRGEHMLICVVLSE